MSAPLNTTVTDALERWRILAELAQDHFAAARFCPSEYEAAEEFAAAAGREYPAAMAALAARESAPGNFPDPEPGSELRNLRNPELPRRARHPRHPTLASVAAQANKAGIEVARYEVKPDGTVVVVTGAPAGDINPWDEVLVDAADTKRPS
jgi:hypothetical protein